MSYPQSDPLLPTLEPIPKSQVQGGGLEQPLKGAVQKTVKIFEPERTFQEVLDLNPGSELWDQTTKNEISQAYLNKYVFSNPDWESIDKVSQDEILTGFNKKYNVGQLDASHSNPFLQSIDTLSMGLGSVLNPAIDAFSFGLTDNVADQQKRMADFYPGIQNDPGLMGDLYRFAGSAPAQMTGAALGSLGGVSSLAKGLKGAIPKLAKNNFLTNATANAAFSGLSNLTSTVKGKQDPLAAIGNTLIDTAGGFVQGPNRLVNAGLQGLTGGASGAARSVISDLTAGQPINFKNMQDQALTEAAMGLGAGLAFKPDSTGPARQKKLTLPPPDKGFTIPFVQGTLPKSGRKIQGIVERVPEKAPTAKKFVDTVDRVRRPAVKAQREATKLRNPKLVVEDLTKLEKKLGNTVRTTTGKARQEALTQLQKVQERKTRVAAKGRVSAAREQAKEQIQATRQLTRGVQKAQRTIEKESVNAPEPVTRQPQATPPAQGQPVAARPVQPKPQPAVEPARPQTYQEKLQSLSDELKRTQSAIAKLIKEGPPPEELAPPPPPPKPGKSLEEVVEKAPRERQVKPNEIVLKSKTIGSGEMRYQRSYPHFEGYNIDTGSFSVGKPKPQDPVWRVVEQKEPKIGKDGKPVPIPAIETKLTLDDAIKVAKAHKIERTISSQVDVVNPQNNVALFRDALDDKGYVPPQIRTEVENYVRAMEDGAVVRAKGISEASGSRAESQPFDKVDIPLYLNINGRTGDIYAMVINENGKLTRRYFREGTGTGYLLRDGKRIKNPGGLVSQIEEAKLVNELPKFRAGVDAEGKTQVYDMLTGEIIDQTSGELTKASAAAQGYVKAIENAFEKGSPKTTGDTMKNLMKLGNNREDSVTALSKAPKDFRQKVYKELTGLDCNG